MGFCPKSGSTSDAAKFSISSLLNSVWIAAFVGAALTAAAQAQQYSSAAEALNDPNACWIRQEIIRGQAADETDFKDLGEKGAPGTDPRFNTYTNGAVGRDELFRTVIYHQEDDIILVKVPCGQGDKIPYLRFEFTASGGLITNAAGFDTPSVFSAGVQDATTPDRAKSSGTGFVGGLGFNLNFSNETLLWLESQQQSEGSNVSRYAPEAKNAYAAYFPLKARPKAQPPRWSWGLDGNVYFFASGNGNVTGIPGGPFGTATGIDTFKISNNIMFTLGGLVTVPVATSWKVSLTGGVAELSQTVKYNCVTFCAVLPATPAFTASQDRWITGGYIGGRLGLPVSLPGLPGASISLDYKHVFFGSYTASFGTIPTRQVNARLSPDMDLVTMRLAVPLR